MASAASASKALPIAAQFRPEALRLYRQMLKSAARFPLRSRREIATDDVQQLFRAAWDDAAVLTADEIEYKLALAKEKAASLAKYSENMYWFHSRDEVTKEMLLFSQQRDKERADEMDRCNRVGKADVKSKEVVEFKHALFNVHPDYYHKVEKQPLKTAQDVWLGRGKYSSHIGAKHQKFYVKRYKPVMPNGW